MAFCVCPGSAKWHLERPEEISVVPRYRPAIDTDDPKHPHPAPSIRPFPTHPDVVVVFVSLAKFMVILVELVVFGRREALMTMVSDWSQASAEPDRPPNHKTPFTQTLQPSKLEWSRRSAMDTEERAVCKVLMVWFDGQTEFPKIVRQGRETMAQ